MYAAHLRPDVASNLVRNFNATQLFLDRICIVLLSTLLTDLMCPGRVDPVAPARPRLQRGGERGRGGGGGA